MTTAMPLITGVDFVCVPTRDHDRAATFYRETLGLEPVKRWGDMPATEFQAGNLTLAVMDPSAFGQPEARPNSAPIAFQVDDVEAARAALEEKGVTLWSRCSTRASAIRRSSSTPMETRSSSTAGTRPGTPPDMSSGSGTVDDPWRLQTPPLSSDYAMHRETRDGREVIVCTVGKTVLLYDARCIDDLHAMLVARGDWVELGSADEQKPVKEGTVEAWARSESNPVGGWYGLKKGLRGRFGMYVPPLMEHLGRAELEHEPRGNRMRAR